MGLDEVVKCCETDCQAGVLGFTHKGGLLYCIPRGLPTRVVRTRIVVPKSIF